MKKLVPIFLILFGQIGSLIGQIDEPIWDWLNQPLNLGHTDHKYIRVTDNRAFTYYIDQIEDTINYKRIVDNIYRDTSNRIYIMCEIPAEIQVPIMDIELWDSNSHTDSLKSRDLYNDTLHLIEVFKDYTRFLDLKSYKKLKNRYFITNSKVYLWWLNSDGDYPIEIKRADSQTFVPFDSIEGGVDKNFVFYGIPPSDFKIIAGANPKKIKILIPKNGNDCYFVDNKNVYYSFEKIEYADSKTFRLVNRENIDAIDSKGEYFKGKLIKK